MRYKFLWFFGLVVLLGWGCEDILEVPDISNASVAILAPMDGSVLTSNSVGFHWDPVAEATSYKIQVATPDFANTAQMLLDSVIVEDSLGNVVTRIERELLNGNYAWRVKAQNSDYETDYSSSGFMVDGDEELDIEPPNTPQLATPADGASQSDTSVSFSWTREDVPGTAERDSIYIFSDEGLTNLATKALGSNKTYVASLASGTFYWYVKAFDAAGNESNASATFNFTITD